MLRNKRRQGWKEIRRKVKEDAEGQTRIINILKNKALGEEKEDQSNSERS